MSGKGNCYDNSLSADLFDKSSVGLGMVETIFKSLKAELIWRQNGRSADNQKDQY